MNEKNIFVLCLPVIICLSIMGCSTNTNNDPKTLDLEEKQNHKDEYTFGYVEDFIAQRTNWNIKLSFLECTDKAIVIKICDYDNQGFVINDLYYELEYLDNGTWVKISYMNENAALKNVGFVFASEENDFVDMNSYNFFTLMPGVTLKSGHYRLTKVLSGRDFSVEFDLNFD